MAIDCWGPEGMASVLAPEEYARKVVAEKGDVGLDVARQDHTLPVCGRVFTGDT